MIAVQKAIGASTHIALQNCIVVTLTFVIFIRLRSTGNGTPRGDSPPSGSIWNFEFRAATDRPKRCPNWLNIGLKLLKPRFYAFQIQILWIPCFCQLVAWTFIEFGCSFAREMSTSRDFIWILNIAIVTGQIWIYVPNLKSRSKFRTQQIKNVMFGM